MSRLASLAGVIALAAAGFANAQTAPTAPQPLNSTVTVTGCVNREVRDGSQSSRATTTATPNTAPIDEANNPTPLDRFMLADAHTVVPATADQQPSKAAGTVYALMGHEAELGKLQGRKVEVTGTVAARVGAHASKQGAEAADGAQPIRVTSVKAIVGACSAAPKK